MWSRRRGIIAGRSASALHGAKWLNDQAPAELLYDYRRPPAGVRTWSDRVEDDEVTVVDGMAVTTPARTALDLACRFLAVNTRSAKTTQCTGGVGVKTTGIDSRPLTKLAGRSGRAPSDANRISGKRSSTRLVIRFNSSRAN